jgi:hypothetical protein
MTSTSSKSDRELLHEYEKTLDSHHQTLDLWNRDRGEATFAALAQFDVDMIVKPEVLPALGSGELSTAKHLKGRQEGVSQAIEWLSNRATDVRLTPGMNRDLYIQAYKFCEFASTYVDIADFYKMYLRGQIGISVDDASKTVRFVWASEIDKNRTIRGYENRAWERKKLKEIRSLNSPDRIRGELETALKKLQPEIADGRLAFRQPGQALEPFVRLANLFSLAEYDFVTDGTDLCGISAGDYGRCFTWWRAWAFALQMAYRNHCVTHTDDLRNLRVVPTQFMARDALLKALQQCTDLPSATVDEVLRRLTYGSLPSSPALYLQPLLSSGDEVAWSPAIITSSSYMRNMLRLMARVPDWSNCAANVIGDRAPAMLRTLGLWFQKRGKCDFKLMRPIKSASDETDIDLLVYSRHFPEDLLIIEGKAILAVDEVNEVDKATVDMQDGQQQATRAQAILKELSVEDKASLFPFVNWKAVKRELMMVVTPNSEPHQGFDHSSIPAISLATINAYMRDNHFASPKKFFVRAQTRPWRGSERVLVDQHLHHQVGVVAYELPCGISVDRVEELATAQN